VLDVSPVTRARSDFSSDQRHILPEWLMRSPSPGAHIEHMSSTQLNDLGRFSEALAALVSQSAAGVVAVKSAAYRVTSGIALHDNLIAVASHSLRREDQVPVHAADGSQTVAAILGRDPSIDLAILKAEGLNTKELHAAETASLKAGSLAAVVGLTVDAGVTASLGVLGAVGPARRNWRGGTLDQFLRLDVNLYPSQSGAAVVNAAGQLIGMATPAMSRHSTIAVPVSTIERIARELLEQGRIRHGYLGVGVQPVAVRGKTDQESGLILLNVEPDSPADKAALLLGDVLLTFDGKKMTDIDDLHSALRGDVIGRTVKAVVLRGGASIEADITVVERGRKS
jgi:S1-C subfamily serine protease